MVHSAVYFITNRFFILSAAFLFASFHFLFFIDFFQSQLIYALNN